VVTESAAATIDTTLVSAWSLADGAKLGGLDRGRGAVEIAIVAPDSQTVALGGHANAEGGRTVTFWNAETGALTPTPLASFFGLFGGVFSPDSAHFVPTLIGEPPASMNTDIWRASCLSPDGKRLSAVSLDGQLRRYGEVSAASGRLSFLR